MEKSKYAIIKLSNVPGRVPSINQITDQRTLVLNIPDGLLYGKQISVDGVETIICFGGQPVNPNGGVIQDVFATDDSDFPVLEHLYKRVGSNDEMITTLLKLNGIVWGGTVIWKEGLTFIVRRIVYYINAEPYFIVHDSAITLDPADADNPRIDLIIVNAYSEVTYLKGIPSADPQKPTPDPLSQLEITQVLVNPNETTPANVTDIIVYDELAPSEYTPSSAGTTVNFGYTGITPYHGTKCVSVTTVSNINSVTFTGNYTNVTDIDSFMCAVKLKAPIDKSYSLFVRFCLNGIIIMRDIKLDLLATDTSTWQVLGFNFASQSFHGTAFNEVVFIWRQSDTIAPHAGFYLDYVKFSSGLTNPPTINSIDLTGDVIGSGVTGSPINTRLKKVNSTPGSYGSNSKSPKLTVDEKGRVINISEVEILGVHGFNYSQSIPSLQWYIIHQLAKYPSVVITDTSGTEVDCEIIYNDINSLTLNFSEPFAGNAHLN